MERLNNPHVTEYTVGPDLIDHYGHVNYRNYPLIYDYGQDDLMASRGWPFSRIENELGLKVVVRDLHLNYPGQIVEGEQILILTEMELGRTSLKFRQQLEKRGEIINEQDLITVFLGAEGKVAIPEIVRRDLES